MTFSIHDPLRLSILLFANLREQIGSNKIQIEIPNRTSIGQLKEILQSRFPQLDFERKKIIVAVNRGFVTDDFILEKAEEVALFPPVSGGIERKNIIKISKIPIHVNNEIRKLSIPKAGGISVFLGIVRHESSKPGKGITSSLEYQTYLPMARKMILKIIEEMREKWPLVLDISFIQRIGKLKAGTISVLIACSSSHRKEGIFEATRYAIDRLKEIVPIWKKEISVQGEEWIEGDFFPNGMDSKK